VREGRERRGMQAGPGSRDVTETSVGTKYKKEVARAASFFYGCTRAQHLRPYPIYLARRREADPASSHRTSRTADESTDCPADIQQNNQVG